MAKKSAKKPRRIKPGPGHFTKEEIAAVTRAAEPGIKTPKAVLDAFLPEPLDLDGQPLQPMSMGVFMILQKCGCRLVGDDNQRRSADNFDAALAGYVLTHPIKDGLALTRLPPEERELAVYEFSNRVPMAAMTEFGEKLGAHMKAAFATVISPASSGEGTGPEAEKKTATGPVVSPPKTTASAGR